MVSVVLYKLSCSRQWTVSLVLVGKSLLVIQSTKHLYSIYIRWRWMFLFDASITLVLAYFGYKYLPDYPHNTDWLTEREKWVASQRVQQQQQQNDSHLSSQLTKMEKVKLLIKNKYLYAFIFGWSSIHTAMGASHVLGIVVKKLGHNAITANLLTTVSFFFFFFFVLPSNK